MKLGGCRPKLKTSLQIVTVYSRLASRFYPVLSPLTATRYGFFMLLFYMNTIGLCPPDV